jgi:hypothetical protein
MIGDVPVPPGHVNPATPPEPELADASLGPCDPAEATSRSRPLQSRQIRRRVFLLHRDTSVDAISIRRARGLS